MSSSVQEFYDAFSGKLVRDYVNGNLRIDFQLGFLKRCVPPNAGSVLVIGCGSGHAPFFIAQKVAPRARILAVDISPENIGVARSLFRHKRIEYRRLDVLAEAPAGSWDVIVLPDVYEHIRTSDRPLLHRNLASSLDERGRVVMTFPSEGHQEMLRRRGAGLQVIDEVVTLDDLQVMAGEVSAALTYFAMISVWSTNDYVHAVMERLPEQMCPLSACSPLSIKGEAGGPGRMLRVGFGRCGLCWRPWRAWRVRTRLRHTSCGLIVG